MILLGPLNTSSQEDRLASWEESVSKSVEAFLEKEMQVDLEEPFHGWVWVPSEATHLLHLSIVDAG